MLRPYGYICKNEMLPIGLLLFLRNYAELFPQIRKLFFQTGDRKMFISLDFTRKAARELIPTAGS
ncbi:MAG: hypothetical protein EAZ78_24070 [Oscillatoriales cyanobacterium]|nr:MAG: hypothetical protein EAZ78_24070 [Oscillatoriales cyanobacterium]